MTSSPALSLPEVALTTSGSPAPRRRGGLHRRDRIVGAAAVAPAVLITLAFMGYPIVYAIWISFTRSDGVDFTFIGLKNYGDLLTSPLLHQVFLTNLLFLVAIPIVILLAVVCSVLLYERVRGWRFFRVLFFVPNVLSTAVIGLMFKTLFGYEGPVNAALGAVGVGPVDFFAEAGSSIFVIVLALVWSGFGYQTLILLAGLNAINEEVFEAATLDGAGWWRRLWSITLPNIRGVIALVSILNVLYTFTSLFGFIFVMTAGGPGYDTTTLDYLIYTLAFSSTELGAGAALAILTFLLIGGLTLLQLRVFRVDEKEAR